MKQGYLTKAPIIRPHTAANPFARNRTRFFELEPSSLSYYEREGATLKGRIQLTSGSRTELAGSKLTVLTGATRLELSGTDLHAWKTAIETAIRNLSTAQHGELSNVGVRTHTFDEEIWCGWEVPARAAGSRASIVCACMRVRMLCAGLLRTAMSRRRATRRAQCLRRPCGAHSALAPPQHSLALLVELFSPVR